jgi:hypothetical protein
MKSICRGKLVHCTAACGFGASKRYWIRREAASWSEVGSIEKGTKLEKSGVMDEREKTV